MRRLKPYLKAVFGFVTPAAVVIGASVLATSDGGTAITSAEWVTALVAAVITGGAVYRADNDE